jgi:hypothetical protein
MHLPAGGETTTRLLPLFRRVRRLALAPPTAHVPSATGIAASDGQPARGTSFANGELVSLFDHSFASAAIYGSLAVMGVIVAMGDHPPPPLIAAVQLFGVTLAIAMAKAYSEILAATLERKRKLNADEGRTIWRAVSPVLFGAQAPTVVFLMSALGWYPVETGVQISKVLVLALLFVYGLRVGQLLHTARVVQIVSGLAIMSAGALVVLMNQLVH